MDSHKDKDRLKQLLMAYGRGASTGLIFGMPLLMTMEMWWSGFAMPAYRMLIFLLFNAGLLLILEHYSGFRETFDLWEEIEDALVALALGLIIATTMLWLFGQLGFDMSYHEILGKIILQMIPVSIGASVAMNQFGKSPEKQRRERAGFWGHLGIGTAGSMFFGFNVAATEEPMMLGLLIHPWQALVLVILSVLLVYAMIFAVDFHGGRSIPEGRHWTHALVHMSLTTYTMSLAVAAYCLWTFGRIDGDTGFSIALHMTIVLGLVTSLGAAAANLLL